MRHYSAECLPRLWWLSPWSTCREMHAMVRAMQALAEQDDRDNARLAARVRELEQAISLSLMRVRDAEPEDTTDE